MEDEVWNDLSLSSLSNHHSTVTTVAINHSLNLQDFLDRLAPTPPATRLSLSAESAPDVGMFSPHPEKKRGLERVAIGRCNDEDRRKRLMKNRESADRARARKQAYTMELEKEVASLKKENAKLRRHLNTFNSEGYAQLPKKHSLRRTLTAPF